MLTRLGTIGVVVFWLGSMAWLVRHDVWPAWTAQDVPVFESGSWLTQDVLNSQARIENKYGHRIGTAWTQYLRTPSSLSRRDVLWLEKLAVLPVLRVEIESDFTSAGELDTFSFEVFGHTERIAMKGERYSGRIAFMLEVGTTKQYFKVDAALGGMVTDAFRPFPALPDIEVGQSWRMQVVNPLAVVSGIGSKMSPLLVRVTGKETITTDTGAVECFVIEAGQAKAWVDANGVALRQEVNLPVGGTFAIIAEPFDPDALRRARSVNLPPFD